MSFISDVLKNIAEHVENNLELYSSIVFGSDPPENGLCMIQGAGFPNETYLNKCMLYQLPILLNGKHSAQDTVLETITSIHELLTKTLDYSTLGTSEVQIVNIETTASPSVIAREQNNQWVVGSSFQVNFFWR